MMVANPFGTSPNDRAYNLHMRSLCEIRDKLHNRDWIRRHDANIRQRLTHALNFRRQFYRMAIEVLIEVLPVVQGQESYSEWMCIINDAYLRVKELRLDRLEAELLLYMAEWVLIEGNYHSARVAADIAQRKIVETSDIEIQILCNIVLLRIQPIRKFQDIKPHMIYQSLQWAKRLDRDHEIRARLYHALAAYHFFRAQLRASERYARTAYTIYRRNRNMHGRLDCAVIQANCAADFNHHRRANRLFTVLQSYVDTHETVLYQGHYLYGHARAALLEDRYEDAIHKCLEARTHFKQICAMPMVANCHHLLTLIYAANGDYRHARQNLAQSRRLWRRLDVDFRLAELTIAHAYVARQEGKLEQAMVLLSQASEEVTRIGGTLRCLDLQRCIRQEAEIVIKRWQARIPSAP
jgi:tetratricopeptide (TPR) repeat protein